MTACWIALENTCPKICFLGVLCTATFECIWETLDTLAGGVFIYFFVLISQFHYFIHFSFDTITLICIFCITCESHS